MQRRHALEFLLVPDTAAARRVRRSVATEGAQAGVVVGTWGELLRKAPRAYFLPNASASGEHFGRALASVEGAFWSASLSAAPEETAKTVLDAVTNLLSASHPNRGLQTVIGSGLASRARRMLCDLGRLATLLGERLPADLATIHRLLLADPDDAPQPIRVHRVAGMPHTTRWQDALIAKLNRDAQLTAGVPDARWVTTLRRCLRANPRAARGSALGALQRRLFRQELKPVPTDSTVQWIRVRDFYQEAEVAAGMVQELLSQDPSLSPADIGLLVPASFEYSVAVEDAFGLAGLSLSGLPRERWRRDLGYEAVFHFLFCRQNPAPAMALAACLSSVLMPWSAEEGAVLAQRVMDGRYKLRPPTGSGRQAREMVQLIDGGDAVPATLSRALGEFSSLLNGGERFALHANRAREAAELVRAKLEAATSIDWTDLRRAVTPHYIKGSSAASYNLEGITVWIDRHEPWRDVRHLVVLGFEQGRYPRQKHASSVFSEGDILAMREKLDLALDLASETQDRLRRLFRRQLRAASDSVSFLVPHRDPSGRAQAPSESLVFMQQLLSSSIPADEFIAELDSSDDRARIRNLARAQACEPSPPRDFRSGGIQLGRDLLRLHTDSEGRAKPESPSGLEMPLVSPLAWLLRRLSAEPLQWAPESDSPRVVGTLAHVVFEELFRPEATLPGPDEIAEQVAALLDDAAGRQAPFFRGPQWHVERRNLTQQAARAASAWRSVIEKLGAQVLATEQWLEGEWAGVPIHGKADLILGLPHDKLLIVDYKWSKSDSRRKRMELGYECQVSLYRAMLRTGGLKAWGNGRNKTNGKLAATLRAAEWIGIAYYTMRDQVCLSDSLLPGHGSIPGWDAVEEDVSYAAAAEIRERIAELRRGEVRRNLETDRERLEKECGITPFAMDVSPLVDLFALPAARRDE